MKTRTMHVATLVLLAFALVATPLLTTPAQASETFVGQIIMFGGNFAIRNHALCNGNLLPISQNTALFSLVGTIYGGDGRTTFGIPDLRGRVPMHKGHGPGLSNRPIGQKAGSETVTLNTNQMPAHNHTATGVVRATSAAGNTEDPAGNVLAQENREDQYINGTATPDVSMAANTVQVTVDNNGGGQGHPNMQPYLVINFQIAITGVYPSRN